MARQPYQPCEKHRMTYCTNPNCKAEESNLGSVSINTEGHLSIGVGSGLAIDPTDGSVGVQIGGFTIDTA